MRLEAAFQKRIGGFGLEVNIASNADYIGILGPSGSGKSMTLRMLAGIEKPDAGYMEVDGRVLYDSAARTDLKPQKRNIGYMFQDYALFPTMSVLKNICCGLRGNRKENREKAMDMIRRMHLDGLEDRRPGELSGGQQQRVALGRILVCQPSLILLDEPFSALDPNLRDHMQRELAEHLVDYDGQVIMVSHNRDELYRFSQDLFVIKDGRIIRSGRTDDIFKNPETVDAAGITGCKNILAAQATGLHTLVLTDWNVQLELEREIPEGTEYIGYRAHYFVPVWGKEQKNCVPVESAGMDRLLFEVNYYFRPKASGGKENIAPICWFVQEQTRKLIEEKGIPDYLQLAEEHIMFLRDCP